MKKFEEVINEKVFQTDNCLSGYGVAYTVVVWWSKKPTGIRYKERTEVRSVGLSVGNALARGLIS